MAAQRLEIRLLGGFSASRDGCGVGRIESQKVRALLAYLGLSRGRTFSRDALAGLLWPEETEDKARRNLRQAIYNLRKILDGLRNDDGLLEVTRREVTLHHGPELWIDVAAFETALERSRNREAGLDAAALGAAVRLYEGELLEGFHLSDALEFEEWLTTERERLRAGAIDALLRLTDHHGESGSYSLGVEYGRRLIKIDPLSEEARCKLMRLHAFSGRRSRAIEEYRELERLLAEELGVEPVEATRAQYRAIVAEELPSREIGERAEPVGPLIPLVGRGAELERLREAHRGILASGGRMSLVTGETGIGTTRLVKTFLHEIAEAQPVLVLQGRYHEHAPLVPYEGIAEALENALVHEVEVAERILGELDPSELAELALLTPVLHELQPGPHPRIESSGGKEHLFGAIAAAFRALCRTAERSRTVIVFLDDLHAADPSSIELLEALRRRLGDEPVWIIGTWSPGEDGPGAAEPPFEEIETVPLERLGEDEVREIVHTLIPRVRDDLMELLAPSGGLPLAITETINLLWDEGFLVEHYDGSWSLEQIPEPHELPASLQEIVEARLSDLPTSTRRLFTMAAIAGPKFDAGLLAIAEHEDGSVVETGIRVLLERWMGRLRLGYWADSRKERDISIWASGTGQGTFEFSHPALRRIVYTSLDPERRAVLHRRVADVLASEDAPMSSRWRSETLAHHASRGRSWETAVSHLEEAGRNALRLEAVPTAHEHFRRALEALDVLDEERPEQGSRWSRIRDRIESLDRKALSRHGQGTAA